MAFSHNILNTVNAEKRKKKQTHKVNIKKKKRKIKKSLVDRASSVYNGNRKDKMTDG